MPSSSSASASDSYLAWKNLRDSFSAFTRACGDRVERFPGATCVRHPSRTSSFNMAFLTGRAGIEPKVLGRIQEFYREVRAEWCFVVPPDLAELFGPTMSRIKITQRRAVPEMVLHREDASIPNAPAGLEITPAKTLDDLRMWARTASAGFEMGRQNNNIFKSMVNATSLERPGFSYLVGRVSGRPVATSASYVSDGVTGIYGVSTIPRARGRGYGEAMTWAVVRDGLSKGCSILSLQASNMGFPIYHRMGFRRIFDFEAWVVPRDAPAVQGSRTSASSSSSRKE